jgi:hypothetical protein
LVWLKVEHSRYSPSPSTLGRWARSVEEKRFTGCEVKMRKPRPEWQIRRSQRLWSICFYYAIFTIAMVALTREQHWYSVVGVLLMVAITIYYDRKQ